MSIGLPLVSHVIPWRKSFAVGMALPFILSEALAVALPQLLMWILLNKSTACYKQNYKQFQVEKENYGFGLHANPFS
jgi:hypothetical protein